MVIARFYDPWVIKWKGHVPEATINSTRVSNLDFYPTIQQVINPGKQKVDFEGIDLNPLFAGETLDDRTLYFHFPIYLEANKKYTKGLRDSLFRTRPGSVIIEGKWKLHHYFEDDAIELYDLEADPSEQKNLAEEQAAIRDRLYQKLDTWRKETGAEMPTKFNPEYDAAYSQKRMEEITKGSNQTQ